MALTTGWQNYLSWNSAVANAAYPPISERQIVFLDLEGDALVDIASRRELDEAQVVPSLIATCREVIDTRRRTSVFQRFAKETRVWTGGHRLDPPPAVALLATFSLAAERMERSEGVASHNYYTQLARLLNLDESDIDVGQSYRKVSEELWDSLSTWLKYQEGRRGDPVTFSVGENRYIGRAKAQALVRDVDRRRFQAFFQEFDLSPRSEIGGNELQELLAVWVRTSRSVSTHIRGLWGQDAARPHIVTAVANNLAAWDGHLTDRHRVGIAASRIRITLAKRRLRRGIDLGVSLNVPQYERARTGTLHTSDGDIEVLLEPSQPGDMKVVSIQDFVDPRSLLEGIMTITDPVAHELQRLPRDLVVLRQDPLAAMWHEVSQVRLGDAVSLLARDTLDLDDVLTEVSGSDWTVHESGELPGLPQGWRLIEGITVVAPPPGPLSPFDDLRTLVPITRTAFQFSGGLSLPIANRCYHRDAPPVVTIGTGGGRFEVTLFDLEAGDPIPIEDPWQSDGEPLSISIAELDLDSGEYGLIVRGPDGTLQERTFTLKRSGEIVLPSQPQRITHDASTALGVVCADNSQDGQLLVEGAPLFGLEVDAGEGDEHRDGPPQIPWWRPDRRAERRSTASIPIPSPHSCLRTNAHKEVVEQAILDHRFEAVGTSLGVCEGCGRVRQYTNSYWRNHKKWKQGARNRDAHPVAHRTLRTREQTLGTDVDWDAALDMVMAVESGDANLLRRITRQFDPSARFFYELIDTLQSAGHIEVAYVPSSMQIESWETAPTTIIECEDHRRLSGHWPATILEELRRAGIAVKSEPQSTAPSLRTVTSSIGEIRELFPDVVVVHRPGITLARGLPALREVLASLPAVNLPDALNFERYMPASDYWAPTQIAGEPGSYRTKGYQRTYYVVLDNSVRAVKRVSAAMAKHAGAMLAEKRALIAYSPNDRELIVPLGAPVPGLYGRALGLASGRVRERRDAGDIGSFEVYPEIPPELATTIHRLLES